VISALSALFQPRQQRGAVLPLSIMILLILSAVLASLSLLTGQEPLVARNHGMIAQAQAIAEAGIERALWALSNPDSPQGVPSSTSAGAPYDGSQLIAVATEAGPVLGGFRLTITGQGERQRQILAVGLVPGDEGPLGRARQEISATAVRLRFPGPPAGLSIRGNLTVGPGTSIDASADRSCGPMAGVWSAGETTLGAGSRVLGNTGDPALPSRPAIDVLDRQAPASFDGVAFTAAELDALKAIARARGTYFRGSVAFNASTRMRDGLVFVDTASGAAIGADTPANDLANVEITSGAGTGPGDAFRGWIIANGSVAISGSATIEGLVYAVDRFSQSGAARLTGGAMAGHIRSTAASLVDARPDTGDALRWSCAAGRTGAGTVTQRWILRPGSYREASS